MNKIKHTPGPWRTSDTGLTTNDGQVAVLAGDDRVALVDAPEAFDTRQKDRWRIESPTRDANARLIAAAPDLLAIAKRIEAAMDFDASDHPMFDGMQKQLLDAIAKAEGK